MNDDTQTSSRDALLAELDLHKVEFSALRTEILQHLDAQRQYLNMSLVAIAAALGFAPFVLEQRAFVSLLLYPVVFHVLLFEMLSSTRIVGQLSGYLVDNIIQRVNDILDQLGDNRGATIVLGWEVKVRARLFRTSDWLLASFVPTRHWIPILAIAALIIFYLVAVQAYSYSPSLLEISLVLINLLFLVVAALRNILVIRAADQENRRIMGQVELVHAVRNQTRSIEDDAPILPGEG